MITTADLKSQTRKELADLARNYGVAGWHGMRKAELIDEIRKVQTRARRSGGSSKPASPTPTATPRKSAARPVEKTTARRKNKGEAPATKIAQTDAKTARIRAQLRRRRETVDRHRDLTTVAVVAGKDPAAVESDRVVLMVRDSYWLHATWNITPGSVQRAKTALAERWHLAKPVLRLMAVGGEGNRTSESVLRDVPIHGGVNNWYLDVDDPPCRFAVVIGYAVGDDFHSIARSNLVETPRPGECDAMEEHWKDIADDYQRIYSLSGGYDTNDGDLREMFEQRMHRTMPLRGDDGSTVNDPTLLRQSALPFKVDAELIVFGKTDPTASVTVGGRPVKLSDDGSFTVRMELPDKRQVLPVAAESSDGLRQRTTVIGIERNTKELEAVRKDEMFL